MKKINRSKCKRKLTTYNLSYQNCGEKNSEIICSPKTNLRIIVIKFSPNYLSKKKKKSTKASKLKSC